MSDYLSDSGFDVVETAYAGQALQAIGANPAIGLVVTDINMPGSMDGQKLSKWLLSHRPDLPVIVTSGAARVACAHRRRRFIAKPYALFDVEKQIRDLLN